MCAGPRLRKDGRVGGTSPIPEVALEFRDRHARSTNHTPVPRTRADAGLAADASEAEVERRRSLDRRLSLWLRRVERTLGRLAEDDATGDAGSGHEGSGDTGAAD